MQVKIKKLNENCIIPTYGHPDEDAGLDLYSMEDYEIQTGERKIFDCGFALEIPKGYAAIVKDKSSLPKNGGLHSMGGVFDSGYRGNYNVMLINLGNEPYKIEKGHKIAQLVILPVAFAELIEVEELDDTSSRGAGQFGSTGK
jgi:dUTP pyrophosphatase